MSRLALYFGQGGAGRRDGSAFAIALLDFFFSSQSEIAGNGEEQQHHR
jgi:hypothetical protein